MTERNSTSRDLSGLRAIVAEDDFHIAFVIQTALEAEGIKVIDTVAQLDVALKVSRTERPDIAIVDIRLGESCSFPLVRLLRDTGVKVILATGTEPAGKMGAEFSGIPVLRKPYTADQLIDVIRKIV